MLDDAFKGLMVGGALLLALWLTRVAIRGARRRRLGAGLFGASLAPGADDAGGSEDARQSDDHEGDGGHGHEHGHAGGDCGSDS
jgi:hypothetical protein